MRREEKKRKKEQEKSKVMTSDSQESSRSSESDKKSVEPELVEEKSAVPMPVLTEVKAKNKEGEESDDIVKAVKQLTLGDSNSSSDKKEQNVIPSYIRVSVVLIWSLCRKEREKLDITLDSTVFVSRV